MDDEMIAEKFDDIFQAIKSIANSITPLGVGNGRDASGGHVESLTEAVMGMTAGLMAISHALESVADAIKDK